MKKQLISASLIAIGFLAGATALSALAAGTWTAPTATPPGNNVDAPINVGDLSQVKTGLLGLNDLIVENLRVITGAGTTTSTAGKVLTALDNNGTVGWVSVGGNSSTEQYNIDCRTVAVDNAGTGSGSSVRHFCFRLNKSTGVIEYTTNYENYPALGQQWTAPAIPFTITAPGSGPYTMIIEDIYTSRDSTINTLLCIVSISGNTGCKKFGVGAGGLGNVGDVIGPFR